MKKIIIILSLLISGLTISQTKQNGDNLLPITFSASPNAASLGIYGQIPVNLYNGAPNININLYSIKVDNFEMPISISYNLSSVKPEERPGWIGLGWNLNAGGAITRIVRGGVDEVMVSNMIDPTVFSYYDHFSELNIVNWDSATKLDEYTNWLHAIAPTKFAAYPAPDEFMFNFNGLSGSFFKNQEGIWVVKANQNIDIKINEELKSDFKLFEVGNHIANDKVFNIKRIFYGFTLTTDDGTQYIFGKNPNAIEFTASANSISDSYNPNFVVKTWYITKVILPNNKTISFQYKTNCTPDLSQGDVTNKAVFKQYISSDIMKYWTHNVSGTSSLTEGSSSGNMTNKILERMYNVYLDKITTTDTQITFNNSLSNDLDYDLNNSPWGAYLIDYVKPLNVSYLPLKHWYKLDDFVVVNTIDSKQIYKTAFKYLENPTSRLFLTSIEESGALNSVADKKHFFEYNAIVLPPYNSLKIDHWGFYNNNNFFTSVPLPANSLYYTDTQIRDNYYTSRNPNPAVIKAGTLTKIIYPTGGFTQFYYEPHDFSKVVDKTSTGFTIINANSSNEIAGGLRIQKIISDPLNNGIPITKEYFYCIDYKNMNATSSGILSGRPVYIEEASVPSMHFFKLSSNTFSQLNDTNGGHVGYTNIVEKSQDGSFIEYTYSNFDNGSIDKLANQYLFKYTDAVGNVFGYPLDDTKNSITKKISFNSMSSERGNMLSEKKYNSQKVIVEESNYIYNNDVNRFGDKIRSIDFSETVIGTIQDGGAALGGPIFSHIKSLTKLAAYTIFSHQTYLKNKETILYDLTNNSKVSTTTDYIYSNSLNHHHLKNTITTTSTTGEKFESKYFYPLDPELATEPLLNNFVSNYLTGVPLVKEQYKAGVLLSKNKTVYANDGTTANLLLPKSIYAAKFPNILPNLTNIGQLEKKITYDKYAPNGIILQYTPENGTPVAIIWGYNKTQPIAKIENATYAQVEALSGFGTGFSIATALTTAQETTLRTSLSSAMITTYTYIPLVGVSTITDPKGDKITYTYDTFNRLQSVKDKDGNILTENEYHYKN
ncbi:RHS repeat domain-containing protein [Flavobacterium restrictum]|uniref:RHS repeat protein n=1 Tax=Flavobacterium restrictum TaxID=2594428 RepID=A0A553DQ19_9FLAO|nr:RHS repeat domain-containing protein [Flavobacterium restrictum]TRX34733.1 RHS repeat protein [Flavobacterium restrictum]